LRVNLDPIGRFENDFLWHHELGRREIYRQAIFG